MFVANAARYDRFEDMAKMGELNEACVMDNLKRRYTSNLIYVNNDLIHSVVFILFRLFRDYSWLQSIPIVNYLFMMKPL